MKKIIAIIAAVAVIAAGAVLYIHFKPDSTVTDGEKFITLVISAGNVSESYEVKTTADKLGKMLVEEGYVKDNQSEYGLYIQTVYGPFEGGKTCDDQQQEWWKVTKNGIALTEGVDETPIANGEQYEITLTIGYENL